MLGRGVKRKRSSLEELDAEVLPNAVGKLVGEDRQDEVSKLSSSHLQQRQLVLSLCLEKLQDCKVGMELSLRRSVLLINTLRQIQEEMQSDGTGTSVPGSCRDSCLLRDDIREVMPLTCPGCSGGDDESRSLPLSPSLPSQEANISMEQQKLLPVSSDAASAMGYLSDLPLDDIFEDIDTSMYETSDLSSAWTAASLWPISVSLWPDEDLKPPPPSHSTGGILTSRLMDLNELDHIMEVLVKS
uniref:SERTA domain-containing protein n=1 Tax=Nothobranchius korthausae TaxID=1143690 RepID=A0A1A8GMM9_9TELE